MPRKCVLNTSGVIINVIVADDDFTPPEGLTLGPDGGDIGDTWDGTQYVKPAPPPPPPLAADDVRAEAQRRIIALTGTADIIGCLIKQHNAQMRATELTLVQAQGGTWTEAEAAEAAALQGLADAIKAIRAASNVLEAMDPIPSDYDADSRWP